MSDLREPTESIRTHGSQLPNSQLHSTLVGMSPSARIIASILGVLVVIGIVLLARGDSTPKRELLFGGRSLSEQELDGVEMSFSHSGLNDWVREGRRISIPAESRSDYLASLQEASSLPVSIRSSVHDAIEKTTIFESSSQRLAREMHAKEQDLGNKLTAFPEVRWASVEYDLGERQGLGRARKQSASVVVCPEGTDSLSNARIETIQQFIRGSYAGMSREDVVVIDTNASDSQCQDPQQRIQLEHQARLEQAIQDILSAYGTIQVAAYVEMEQPKARPEKTADKQVAHAPKANDGLISRVIESVTHVRSNRPTRLEQPAATETDMRRTPDFLDSPADQRNAVIRDVRVSIGLPESYYHRVWEIAYRRQHPHLDHQEVPGLHPEQLQSLKDQTKANIMAAVMPVMYASNQRNPSAIEVWTFPDLPNQPEATPNFAAMSFSWLGEHWQQASLVLMGLIGLCLAVVNLRPQSKEQRLSVEDRILNEDRALAGQPTPVPQAPVQSSWEIESSQADLLALIDQNPDAAADVIRDWIADAA